jgi:hypothetical protein
MGSDRDARTASRVQDVAIDVEWISEPLQEQIDDFRDHARIAAIGNNDDELVARVAKAGKSPDLCDQNE